MNSKQIKISIVSYFNTLPFRYALKHSELINRMDLQEDMPSICAQKLKFKQVEIGLVPVALLPELDAYEIITDYCIGADGKVDSVKLYSDAPLDEIKRIVLDYQSKSSITLTKVLNKFYWKKNVEYVDAKPSYEQNIKGDTAAVVIGDRTFALNGSFRYEFDLAEEWKKFTGLPFAFAAWVATSKVDPDFVKEFNAVLSDGVNNIRSALNESTIKHPANFDAYDYLSHKIDYRLDAKKREALSLFLEYISKL